MSKISSSLLSLIGETPLVEIKNIDTGLCKLYVKMESHNPGGSIKDRTATYIIDQAEKEGLLKPGGTIIEATAGNTGIGIAIVAKEYGLKVKIVIPKTQSVEKKETLIKYGAELIEVDAVPYSNPKNYIKIKWWFFKLKIHCLILSINLLGSNQIIFPCAGLVLVFTN